MTPGAVAALLREGAEELQAEDAQPMFEDARVEVPAPAQAERLPMPPPMPLEPEPPPSPERPFDNNPDQEMDIDQEIENNAGQFENNADQFEDNADQFENNAGQIENDADQEIGNNADQEIDADYETEGVHVLETKPTMKSKKGRELNDKRFDNTERKQLRDADVANWEKHLRLGAAEVVPPQKASEILRNNRQAVLPVAARFVRTNGAAPGEGLQAKSRLVIPGHLLSKGRQDGQERTDSPTAGTASMMVLLAIASHFHWPAAAFDVEAAFLTGLGMKRELTFDLQLAAFQEYPKER